MGARNNGTKRYSKQLRIKLCKNDYVKYAQLTNAHTGLSNEQWDQEENGR